MKADNKNYIDKWLDIPQWFTEETWQPTGEKFKTSKLKPGQIEGLLYKYSQLKKEKNYKLADSIRDRLVEIGYIWKEPKDYRYNTGNLCGHIINKLEFKSDKEKVSLQGYIHTTPYSFADFDFTYEFELCN